LEYSHRLVQIPIVHRSSAETYTDTKARADPAATTLEVQGTPVALRKLRRERLSWVIDKILAAFLELERTIHQFAMSLVS
jgi:hypothetical protein